MPTPPPDKLSTHCSMRTTHAWLCTYAEAGEGSFSADDWKYHQLKWLEQIYGSLSVRK